MKQSSVINDKSSKAHIVEPYRFKVLGTFSNQNEEEKFESVQVQTEQIPAEISPEPEPNLEPQEAPKSSPEPSLIEELLGRIDELSGNMIKLQMQIENQEREFASRLESEVLRAKEDGILEGENRAKTKFEESLQNLTQSYNKSISKLDEISQIYQDMLTKNETELTQSAINLAKEVILLEVNERPEKIATKISKALMDELKEASHIEIKINPNDFDFVSQNFKEKENLKLVPDEAISPGGAIILTDIGNIDGTILNRFNKLTKILSE